MPPAISLQGVERHFDSGGRRTAALDGVTVEVEPATFVAVVGRSGSGKSTLLNVVAGIDRPSSGRVTVAGTDITQYGEDDLAAWRGRTVGVVFQFFQLLPTLTALENVILPMELCRTVPAARRRERALDLLARVGVAGLGDQMPATLSGGEAQRVAVARALANDPPVLVADEPTGNLDAANRDNVLGILRDVAASGTTVLMVTHEVDAGRWVDRTVALDDGRVVDDAVALAR